MSLDEPQPVIGLEVHCQLATDTRLFSTGPVDYDAAPNSRVTPYDLGMPGTLPVLNQRAVDFALRAGLALDCTIHSRSRFARKHYFYPDLPKGFQITQYDRPLCSGGRLVFDHDGRTRSLELTRIHLEEDAGKLIHDDSGSSLADYNRAGVPLVEIVTQPELTSPEEAADALRALHRLVVHLGICDGNMQQGSFRCDANLSLATDTGQVGPRIELKNLNSFRFVRRGLAAEIRRLRAADDLPVSGSGDETRWYDPDADETISMRSKEASPDYRYVADPDLPDLIVDHERIHRVRDELPELPRHRRRRYVDEFDLAGDDADILLDPPARARFFEAAVETAPDVADEIANLLIHELLSLVDDVDDAPLSASELCRVAKLSDNGVVSSSGAATLLEELLETDESPDEIVDRLDLRQVSDTDRLEQLVDEILADDPELVEEYRDGKQKLFGHFMGQIMQASSGRADPEKASEILRERLAGD